MPIILAALALIAGAYVFVLRSRAAAEMTSDLLDVADDVRAAARRFLFKRRGAGHPVDDIEDQDTAIAAVACAFLALSDFVTDDDRAGLQAALAEELDLSARDATGLMVLGRWLSDQCGTPAAAVTRAGRKLYKLKGPAALEPLMAVVARISADGLSDRQRDALDEIKAVFRLR